jgi:hypothetical protein
MPVRVAFSISTARRLKVSDVRVLMVIELKIHNISNGFR